MRVAVVDKALCRPSKCSLECVRFCPVNRSGSKCVWIDETEKKARISEELCVGCGICIKKCPYSAISIINLPEKLSKSLVHRYGPNAFELFRLPTPKEGRSLGILGSNGVGKSTSLKILAGVLKPNLGRFESPPDWDEIIDFFKGSELQPYFEKMANGRLRVSYKPQAVDSLRKYDLRVGEALQRADERNVSRELADYLNLSSLKDRLLKQLSGGELQKVAIAAALSKDADVYLLDEPSSYLDIRERLRVANLIKEQVRPGKYVIIVEHDLAVLDYVSDLVSIIYGEPGVYGIVGIVKGVRAGINSYIQGYIREENIRFREYPIEFHERPPPVEWPSESVLVKWGTIHKSLGEFTLRVEEGRVHRGEVVGVLGPNGIGKTTFVRILAGEIEPDEGWVERVQNVRLSYKPQFLGEVKFEGTVREFLRSSEVDTSSPTIQAELMKPLRVHSLLDHYMQDLSGGELQRVLIVAALGREADIYLLDEPMAYLDVEQRYAVAKVIKRLTAEKGVSTIVVEHDIVAIDFLAMTLMVFRGIPGKQGEASSPMDMRKGMNLFLKDMSLTFRRDPDTKRPRINKPGSWMDRYQKEVLKEYYYVVMQEKESENSQEK
ncbi:MAG: ribosome biogenesis/translation initiation ATPase RLI [Infirmifilum sp.]|jgi:ATP-binding cassette subfamily E protein 1|uniref:ATPase n=1 Tax=Infirmifilum uzonense TaxID=1550241 RepID=A0A0F7FH73_9CREN|nr:ribosome biogenesis/translation initiation ATPase RLI [Infirmifilum uzonense]AKG38063.1 ATPase [Infirmifilum uzonense]